MNLSFRTCIGLPSLGERERWAAEAAEEAERAERALRELRETVCMTGRPYLLPSLENQAFSHLKHIA